MFLPHISVYGRRGRGEYKTNMDRNKYLPLLVWSYELVSEGLHEDDGVAMILSPSEKVMSFPALWRSSRTRERR